MCRKSKAFLCGWLVRGVFHREGRPGPTGRGETPSFCSMHAVPLLLRTPIRRTSTRCQNTPGILRRSPQSHNWLVVQQGQPRGEETKPTMARCLRLLTSWRRGCLVQQLPAPRGGERPSAAVGDGHPTRPLQPVQPVQRDLQFVREVVHLERGRGRIPKERTNRWNKPHKLEYIRRNRNRLINAAVRDAGSVAPNLRAQSVSDKLHACEPLDVPLQG